MYESFYNFTEKPFTLLPDPGFLYLSDKHRMALTVLEYGLAEHAGFTVIRGEIGAGKTTLIRHMLNNMEQEYTVGLISNTHSSFGELLQWILLAFNLDHDGMNKVEMYQRFVDFIIDEYSQARRTVLIIDEAQNMNAETLEELRMLSNINADKDQALQVILVGQRELRETLKRPDLVQFAQRITVDYHLQPLSAAETVGYIMHRLEVAGGDPGTFTRDACEAVHRFSNGVPRLINLLCDTALVYGYAEQTKKIDARLVTDVAREKQQGGIFPIYAVAENGPADDRNTSTVFPNPAAGTTTMNADVPGTPASHGQDKPVKDVASESPLRAASISPVSALQREPGTGHSEGQGATDAAPPQSNDDFQLRTSAVTGSPGNSQFVSEDDKFRWEHGQAKKKLRVGVCSAETALRHYLSRLLESYGFEVVVSLSMDAAQLTGIDLHRADVILVDRDPSVSLPADISEIISSWNIPVLYNDSSLTTGSLREGNPDFGLQLSGWISSLVDSSSMDITATR